MPDPTLLILPGDGIGPEVMAEVRKVVDWLGREGMAFAVEEDLVGGAAHDAHGAPISDETMAKAQAAGAVLLGAVGGPKWDALDFSLKPERGLLRLRKEMDLFANLRPAVCFDALADLSTLKREVVAGLDILIVRELTSGIYFGEPQRHPRGGRRARRRQHPALHGVPDRARGARGLRAGAQASGAAVLDGEGQRHGVGRALARCRHQDRRRGVSRTSSSATCTPTRAPCSSCATPSSST